VPPLLDWLDAQSDRVSARQRSRVDTAKLVATFVAAVAGSLVASALQTGESASGWDWVSAWALAATIALTVAVMDRLTEPDHEAILSDALTAGLTPDETLSALRLGVNAANHANEGVVYAVGVVLWLQLGAAVFTGVAAAYSMLNGSS
jgi:hypothetical protein